MTNDTGGESSHAALLAVDRPLLDRLRDALTPAADEAVGAIVRDIPSYAELSRRDNDTLTDAVQLALGHFLTLAARQADAAVPIEPSTVGAYDLGRGEARSGRSLDALLAAYRIGARVSWRRLSRIAADGGMSATALGAFAELVFAYIDELTAASVAGHADELAKTGRARRRNLERLVRLLVAQAPADRLAEAADQAGWTPPTTLTAVLLPEAIAATMAHRLDPRTLHTAGDLGLGEDVGLLLVPDVTTRGRARLADGPASADATIGPSVPWQLAGHSVRRAQRGAELPRRPGLAVDTDDRLVDLVLRADPEALADLRARTLAPLEGVRRSMRAPLEATLRSWLLHQGRRQDVARDLHVHPQTVRYRMGLLRERFGDTLDDPGVVLALVVALGAED